MTHHLIKPCAECDRMTRPTTVRFADFPDTIVRRGELCDSCWRCAVPVLSPVQERARTYHLAGLTSFLARRHARELSHARADHLHKYLERVSA